MWQAEESPGFLDALLNILDAEQDNGVRLSSVYSCGSESHVKALV